MYDFIKVKDTDGMYRLYRMDKILGFVQRENDKATLVFENGDILPLDMGMREVRMELIGPSVEMRRADSNA